MKINPTYDHNGHIFRTYDTQILHERWGYLTYGLVKELLENALVELVGVIELGRT